MRSRSLLFGIRLRSKRRSRYAHYARRSPRLSAFPTLHCRTKAGIRPYPYLDIDLPDLKTPTAIAVSGDNGRTPGGHTIGTEFGGQPDPKNPADLTWQQYNLMYSATVRTAFSREDYQRWVPLAGQLVVASRWENKITFIDLKPFWTFIRDIYFGADDQKRMAAAATDVWPYTFTTNPEMMPVVVGTFPVQAPTVVRIENQPNTNGKGLQKSLKAWVGNVAGEVHLFDISSFVQDQPRPISPSAIKDVASLEIGRNLTSMTLRGGADHVIVTSRGDRSVQWVDVVDTDGTLQLTRTLRDARFDDPVIADASDRGPVVTIGDFSAAKIFSYRYGMTENNGTKPPANYGCGDGGSDTTCQNFEFGGSLSIPGAVFFLGTTNVN